MADFKVGDVVRCIDATGAKHDLEEGKEYKVSSANGGWVGLGGQQVSLWMSQRFKLVERIAKCFD